MSGITIEEQIQCVRREIRMRDQVYPRWVAAGKLKQEKSDHEIAAMKAVLATLEGLDRFYNNVASSDLLAKEEK